MSDAIKRAARERMAETGEPYTLARRMVIEERARLKAAEPEVTPENARQLFTEGKITVNQARQAHGLPPFEPAIGDVLHDGFAHRHPRAWDYPVGGPGCPGCDGGSA